MLLDCEDMQEPLLHQEQYLHEDSRRAVESKKPLFQLDPVATSQIS